MTLTQTFSQRKCAIVLDLELRLQFGAQRYAVIPVELQTL